MCQDQRNDQLLIEPNRQNGIKGREMSRKSKWGYISVLGGISLFAFLFLNWPTIYTAQALVVMDDSKAGQGPKGYNPYWMTSEVELIQSPKILGDLIAKLHLVKRWAVKDPFITEEKTLARLSSMVAVFQPRCTSLAAIIVRSKDPIEAAAIASAIAEIYASILSDTKPLPGFFEKADVPDQPDGFEWSDIGKIFSQ
jgi:uncharacterized protein involved in exopolysaccharide biosynthesis